ncbi:MAG: glutaredoxin family protein [Gammaproteobacteria bacterium]|uniref:glutaredoxin family protein n=1 Tax=Pseudomaricurvus alcaniphilus TaxID=1166482 RepID=UPI001409D4AC|nr:glutaredoxin family protein [Pseudomaricurvus alcaniphilus]MBR9912663.1 glutaredoxin family protein [Gammaproteobacteria bacterium]NHN35977.1 glutaredoxin family protein [Pseudomaricurvus alcaniphilus]
MQTLYLYTTLGCHLCEQAKTVMWPVLEHYGYRLQEIEIANDDEMVERYGIRIPVVRRDDCERDLGWPFSAEQLAAYLAADKS